MAKFWERQYRRLPKQVKTVVRTNVEAAKIKAQEGLKKLAEPAAQIIAKETKKAGAQSIGPWIATATIVLALIFISRGRK